MFAGRGEANFNFSRVYAEKVSKKQRQSNGNPVAESAEYKTLSASGYRYPDTVRNKTEASKFANDRRWLADGASALDCFRHHLTEQPYVCDDFDYGLLIRHRDNAADYSHIQHNHPKKILWLVFDIDRGNQSFYAYEEAGLPQPNIIVQNPLNGNCHIFYRLAQPVWTQEQPIWTQYRWGYKAQNYLKRIYASLVEKMAADRNYHPSSVMCKNPLSSQWRVFDNHNHPVTLDYLADFADFSSKKRSYIPAKAPIELDGLKRNCSLFELLRQYSYERIGQYKLAIPQPVVIKDGVIQKFPTSPVIIKSYDTWLTDLSSHAQTINQTFEPPLPLNEVKHVVKSVGKWTWHKYQPVNSEKKQRGIMGFGETRHTDLSLAKLSDTETKARQSAAAMRTHQIKKDKTETAIKAAIAELNSQGKRVTKAAIAKIVEIDRIHLGRKYAHLFC